MDTSRAHVASDVQDQPGPLDEAREPAAAATSVPAATNTEPQPTPRQRFNVAHHHTSTHM
jgi:hypothetical protein